MDERHDASGFIDPAIAKILKRLDDVELGLLTLGQPLSTLWGGERQRPKQRNIQ
jgi:excinuclease UvrABC ATPase subunit